MGYIYKITNNINGKIYIGKTSKTIEDRFKKHIANAKKHINRYLYDAMNHYGYDNFYVECIEECDNDLLDEREIYWIQKYNCIIPNGYNMTSGGEGGNTWEHNPHKDLTSMKLIMANRGRCFHSPEFYEELSKRFTGRKGSSEASKRAAETKKEHIAKERGWSSWDERVEYQKMVNKLFRNRDNFHHTDESRKKMSEARKGKTWDDIYGKEKSDLLKKEMSKKFSGENNPNYCDIDRDVLLHKILDNERIVDIAKYFNCQAPTIHSKCKLYFGTSKTSEVKALYAEQER